MFLRCYSYTDTTIYYVCAFFHFYRFRAIVLLFVLLVIMFLNTAFSPVLLFSLPLMRSDGHREWPDGFMLQ